MSIIIEKENCVGCTACYSVCPVQSITMQEDHDGFLYPEINTKMCMKCGECQRICPLNRIFFKENNMYPESFLAKEKEKSVLNSAAAGGAFTALAIEFIKKYNGVIFGVDFDEKLEVFHTCAETEEAVKRFSKSKYVQSRMGNTFSEVRRYLELGRFVLFSGTPCQVYGLKSFLNQRYEKLFCIDLVCHGVPSPKVFRKYRQWHQSEHGVIQTIRIRDKKLYANFYRAGFGVEFKNGYRYFRTSDEDIMGKLFLGGISSRPSCYDCKFKSIWRESDLTIGDCWFSEELAGVKDPDGITLVLVQSNKGANLLKNSERLEIHKVDSVDSIKANGGMIYSSARYHPNRKEFFSDLDLYELDKLEDKYIKKNKNFTKRIISLIKNAGIIPRKAINLKNRKMYKSRINRDIPTKARGKVSLP